MSNQVLFYDLIVLNHIYNMKVAAKVLNGKRNTLNITSLQTLLIF